MGEPMAAGDFTAGSSCGGGGPGSAGQRTSAEELTSVIRLSPETPHGTRIPLLLDNESWSYAWTPDVRCGKEKLYQAFQLHTHHLHRYELVVR
jgi:hypothetical protein